jgi:hypothetical protein
MHATACQAEFFIAAARRDSDIPLKFRTVAATRSVSREPKKHRAATRGAHFRVLTT